MRKEKKHSSMKHNRRENTPISKSDLISITRGEGGLNIIENLKSLKFKISR